MLKKNKKTPANYKNKGLIKEAVEFHLLHASSFTSAHKEGHFRGRAEAELLRDDLTRVKNVLSINNPRIQDFEAQKVKNERIVEKCKELLKELE
ncbi:12684_t:CDS:2 [Funneliformis geosporum]|uniref:3481_t:CDS:1 n=1 Tax=Funneliformis geosporum TaxID=1117311 RepID=A0A9W4SQW4_9GLOM|nr:12684_t:CDS:2 [Funneliformis geosporum]CAI2178333.1 3481_t:CDS:2 [Funneliformis geosporum]